MDTLTQILNNLHKLPEKFCQHCEEEQWCAACADYEYAVIISRFIQMDQEPRTKLLSQFDVDAVQQAFRRAGRWKNVK